ncbi:MAG TPA: hypothetical protein PLZ56_11700 [Anaerolineae bacterium]|nr:hypothetical protein [Anaerolineae bacterium]
MTDVTDRSRFRRIALAIVPGVLLLAALTACGEDEPTPRPPSADQRPATLVALPSATELPTKTPLPTATVDVAAEATQNAAGLPGGDEVILQFARIEPRANEPALAAEFRPNFSMRAGGHVVYAFRDDYSQDDWYQTVLTPSLGADFVRILWDDIGIAELAEKLAEPKLAYTVNDDGSVDGPGPVGVIYVKSNKGSARLVVSQKDLESPAGPYGERLARLQSIIRALEYWRGSTATPASPEIKQLVIFTLGWWQDRREAWGPDRVTAFGTKASADQGTAGVAWPLDKKPLAGLVKAAYGAKPTRFELQGEDAAAAWRTDVSRADGGSDVPLWRDGDVGYLMGLRAEVPGSNEVILDYSFKAPKPPTPTAAPTNKPTTQPAAGSSPTKAGAVSRPTVAVKATATKKP